MSNKTSRYVSNFLLALLFALISGCDLSVEPQMPATPTLFIITATLPPTWTPPPTSTPLPPTIAPTVAPVEGTTTTQVNVRSAPSATATMLGTLTIFTKVQIIGTDASKTWWQIVYEGGADGKGWVAATYVQTQGAPDVPVIEAANAATSTAVTAGTAASAATSEPTEAAAASTPTAAPAPLDGDSAQSPAASVEFLRSGPRSLIYSSAVSAPEGDAEDWIQFKTFGAADETVQVDVVLACTGAGTPTLELWGANSVLQRWADTACGTPARLILSLYGSNTYSLRIQPSPPPAGTEYVAYSLSIEAIR
ncbi:MAG: SH3 domain-containing protein [Chloroflexota bacterium]